MSLEPYVSRRKGITRSVLRKDRGDTHVVISYSSDEDPRPNRVTRIMKSLAAGAGLGTN